MHHDNLMLMTEIVSWNIYGVVEKEREMDNGFQEVLDPEITLEVLVLEMTIHGLEDFQEDPDQEIILQLETIGLHEDRDRVTIHRRSDGVEDLYLHRLV